MSTNKTFDIFVKRSEINSDEDPDKLRHSNNLNNSNNSNSSNSVAISRKDIIQMIPKDCLKQPNEKLAMTNTEWRWRVFKLPNKINESIEISLKHPNEERKYINKNGEWIYSNVPKEFDSYVTCEYYYYN